MLTLIQHPDFSLFGEIPKQVQDDRSNNFKYFCLEVGMNWIQFPILPFLLVVVPVFQYDQTIDWAWLICDNSLIIKSDGDLSLDRALGPCSEKTDPTFRASIRFISLLKHPLSVSHGFFQGTSPFWRPPPG
jgi:hypothetical protein